MTYSLTGNTVSSTYGRLVQVINNNEYYDGFGNPLNIGVGTQGPSGPQGSQGFVVPMVQPSAYWIYQSGGVLNEISSFVANNDLLSDVTSVEIQYLDIYEIDYTNWFEELKYFVDTQQPSFLYVSEVNNKNTYGLYKVSSVSDTGDGYELGVDPISFGGSFVNGVTYSISWSTVAQKGNTGNQGETGLQGNTGPQGNTGVQGETGPQGNTGLQGPQGHQGSVVAMVQTIVQWTYGGLTPSGVSQNEFYSSLDSFSDNTEFDFSFYDINDVDYQSWFQELSTFVNNGNTSYLQIFDSLTQSFTGLYKITDVIADANSYKIIVETPSVVSNGTFSLGLVYNVTWVANGSVGPQGETGLQGPQGFQGDTGPQGLQGTQGLQGETGPQGLQGETGPQGFQGFTGPQGLQGETGPQGIQGETGLQGFQGFTGPQGLQGETGPQGFQGETGPQGPQGLTGPQGFQGYTGPQGLTGETGSQGSQGIQGSTGPQGFQGSQGAVVTMVQTIVQWKYKGANPVGNSSSYFASSNTSFDGNTEFQIHFNDINNNDYQYWFQDLDTFVSNGNPSYLQIYSSITASNVGLYRIVDLQKGSNEYSLIVSTPSIVANGSFNIDEIYNITWVANGSVGSQGNTGVQGFQGFTGPQGSEGFQGFTGPQGNTGQQGSTGFQGETGAQGSTGSQGSTGFQGETGPQGNIGFQGSTGFQGETGPQGVVVSLVQTIVQWTYDGLVGGLLSSGMFESTGGSFSNNTRFTFNQLDVNGVDYGNWFDQLNTFVLAGNPSYLQIYDSLTSSNTGLYKVTSVVPGTTTYSVFVDSPAIVSNGKFTKNIIYNVTWVSNGSVGERGETGIQGETGPQGFAGIGGTGPQGHTGIQGETGPQGSTGNQGETGPQGTMGPQGLTGVQGFTGPQGDTGNQGFTGPQGFTGLQGETGPQGATGASLNYRGDWTTTNDYSPNDYVTYNGLLYVNYAYQSAGNNSPDQVTGAWIQLTLIGTSGFQGETGPQGFTGLQGETGPQGFDGNQGFTGPQGLTGLQGSTGPQGGTGAGGIVVTSVQSLVEWKYLSGGSLGSATQSFVSNNNSISSVTDLNFSKYNYNGVDYSGWFNELNTFVTSGFSTYLQLFQVGTPSNIGLFKVGTVSSGVDAFTVSFTNIIVSNGTLVDSSLYSFTWVANGKEGPQGPTGFGTGGGTSSSSSLPFFYQSAAPTASSLTAGSRWFHSDTGVEYVYINDGDSTQWVQPTSTIVGSLNHYTLGVTNSSYNITLSSQYGPEYFGVSSSVTSYVYLPTNVSLGKSITVKDESGSASINNIYIFAYSGETIDNSTQSLISTDYGSKTLLRRNNNWWLI